MCPFFRTVCSFSDKKRGLCAPFRHGGRLVLFCNALIMKTENYLSRFNEFWHGFSIMKCKRMDRISVPSDKRGQNKETGAEKDDTVARDTLCWCQGIILQRTSHTGTATFHVADLA